MRVPTSRNRRVGAIRAMESLCGRRPGSVDHKCSCSIVNGLSRTHLASLGYLWVWQTQPYDLINLALRKILASNGIIRGDRMAHASNEGVAAFCADALPQRFWWRYENRRRQCRPNGVFDTTSARHLGAFRRFGARLGWADLPCSRGRDHHDLHAGAQPR